MAQEIQIFDESTATVQPTWDEIRKAIIQARAAQENLRPVRDAYLKAKKANQRMDGPEGFVMKDGDQ